MNETSINPISSVRSNESSLPTTAHDRASLETAVVQKPVSPAPDKAPIQKKNEPTSTSDPSNISISFRIDEETQNLTVYVVDRISKRVLRTIPASELHKLKAGDLLKLTA
jgi:uncharacterized FlaG/YvyC family protein